MTSLQRYAMADGDADGGDRHVYVQSPETGWTDFYRDLMTGQVREGGSHRHSAGGLEPGIAGYSIREAYFL